MMTSRRLSDQIVQILQEKIQKGEYAEGQKLTELSLAGEFGVSQGTIRAAFGELVSRGLLETRPHRGTCVRQVAESERREARIVRAGLEGLAVEQTGAKITACAPQLRQALQMFLEAATRGDESAAARANHEFHRVMVRAAGNSVLLRTWEGLHDSPVTGPSYAGLSAVLKDMAEAHNELVELAERGDYRKLAKRLTNHPNEMERIIDRASDAQS